MVFKNQTGSNPRCFVKRSSTGAATSVVGVNLPKARLTPTVQVRQRHQDFSDKPPNPQFWAGWFHTPKEKSLSPLKWTFAVSSHYPAGTLREQSRAVED
jgi:hypothetical protein